MTPQPTTHHHNHITSHPIVSLHIRSHDITSDNMDSTSHHITSRHPTSHDTTSHHHHRHGTVEGWCAQASVWASHWLVAPNTFSRQIFSLVFFFPSESSAPGLPENYWYITPLFNIFAKKSLFLQLKLTQFYRCR